MIQPGKIDMGALEARLQHKVLFLCLMLPLLTNCATPTTQRVAIDSGLLAEEARKQREIALEESVAEQQRLNRIAYPVLVAGLPLCKDQARLSLGVYFANRYSLSKDMRDAGASLYGLGESLQITQVIESGPGAEAGLRAQDVLVALNGTPTATGENAAQRLTDVFKGALHSGEPVSLVIQRDGDSQTVQVQPRPQCHYPVLVGEGDDVNAYADGERIVIFRGMLRFSQSDTELGLVIAHELAHNVMGHMRAKKTNALFGTVLDIAAAVYGVNTQGAFGGMAAQAYSQDFEAEADYVGLYILANAGGDIANAPKFWRRMAAAHPGSIRTSFNASHPATAERFVALEQTVEEIRSKQQQGLPLMPELKKPQEKRALVGE